MKALPDGGKCMGFVGLLGADNATRAHRGLQAGDRGLEASSSSTCAATTSTSTRAKRNVEDVLAANPEINCMVGFYSYNPPRIYEALKAAGKLGQITVIALRRGSDHAGRRARGTIAGTVVQQPYEWGYQGMKLMADYLEGDKSGVPENKLIIVPTKVIDKANVDAVRGRPEGGDQRLELSSELAGAELALRAGLVARAGHLCCNRAGMTRAAAVPPMADPFLELVGITKTYPGVDGARRRRACRSARRGHRPDRRERRRQVDADEDPGRRRRADRRHDPHRRRRARRRSPSPTRCAAGIAFVHQELNLFDNLDVAANVFIGREPLHGGPLQLIDRKRAARRRASRCSSGSASISGRHAGRRAVARPAAAASRSPRRCRSNARLVIMDEPTSSLTADRDRAAAAASSPT